MRFLLSCVCDLAGHRWERVSAAVVHCRRCKRELSCYYDKRWYDY